MHLTWNIKLWSIIHCYLFIWNKKSLPIGPGTTKLCHYSQKSPLCFKNPAYGRQRISRLLRIVAPILFFSAAKERAVKRGWAGGGGLAICFAPLGPGHGKGTYKLTSPLTLKMCYFYQLLVTCPLLNIVVAFSPSFIKVWIVYKLNCCKYSCLFLTEEHNITTSLYMIQKKKKTIM